VTLSSPATRRAAEQHPTCFLALAMKTNEKPPMGKKSAVCTLLPGELLAGKSGCNKSLVAVRDNPTSLASCSTDEPPQASGQAPAPNDHDRQDEPAYAASRGSDEAAQDVTLASAVKRIPSAGTASLRASAKRKSKAKGTCKGKGTGKGKGKGKGKTQSKAKAARKEAAPHPQMGLSDEELVELARKRLAQEREERKANRKAAAAAARGTTSALIPRGNGRGLKKLRPPLGISPSDGDPAAEALMLLLKVSGLTPQGHRPLMLDDILNSGLPQCVNLDRSACAVLDGNVSEQQQLVGHGAVDPFPCGGALCVS